MKNKKRTLVSSTVAETDENGVVKRETTQKTTVQYKEPPFVKLYLEDISNLNSLSPSQNKVMRKLLSVMTYNNIIPSYKSIKKLLSRDLGMPYQTFDSCIKGLYKKGILIRLDKGLYMMDPKYFGKGTWEHVDRIRMTIEYDLNGKRVVNTDIARQLEFDFS